ncbi:MAG: GntR family transcriptional regulator [Candidatus Aminicenantes bacterium]|jgi:GntR family transcriptional regulator
MFIAISPHNPDPMYKQVTDQIKDAIASGTLKPETKLPSIREMAKELKISMITIKRAYADLESEGYILTRSGMGSFVVDINRDKLREEKLAEIRSELTKILNAAARYGITPEDIFITLRRKGVKG